jgi:hypothetical protein
MNRPPNSHLHLCLAMLLTAVSPASLGPLPGLPAPQPPRVALIREAA